MEIGYHIWVLCSLLSEMLKYEIDIETQTMNGQFD